MIWDRYYRRRGEKVIELYSKVDKLQWLPQAELQALCAQRLETVLATAAASVPYYRKHAPGARALSDFPVLDKQALQEDFMQLRSEVVQPGRAWLNSTSGSSGRPTNIMLDSATHAWRTATGWRGDCFGGYRPTDRQVVLWGQRREKRGPLKSSLANYMFNRYMFSIFNMDAEYTRFLHSRMRALRPRILCGYVTGLLAFVYFSQKLGLEPPRLGKIMPTAESCTPEQAAEIGAYFQAPVQQRYGAVEVGDLAHQCEAGNWHVHCEHLHLEVEDAGGAIRDTGVGNIIVTSLSNLTMPLVRYRIGDYGDITQVACPCGRSLPTITRVSGRSAEFVYCADKSRISSLAFTHSIRKYPIRQFRVVQEVLDEVQVLYIPQDNWTPADLEALTQELLAVVRGRLRLRMQPVERIEPMPSGKHSHIVNKLGPQLSSPQ
jgi:phenylacetate-CoA ligase